MAGKTITFDADAYKRLQSNKQEDESYNDLIRRLLPRPFDLQAWLKTIDTDRKPGEPVECVDCVVPLPNKRPRHRDH